MIVGFLADKIPYHARRGWGVYSYHLLKALLATDRDNTYRCFYNMFRKGTRERIVSVEGTDSRNLVWPIPGRIMDLLWERWAVLPVESFLGPIDILHVPYEFLPPTRKARSVVTVHDVTFLSRPEYLEPGFVKLFSGRIRRIVEKADRIIACSESTKKELMKHTGAGEERIRVIPEGVDGRFVRVDDSEVAAARLKYGISGPYFLFVGAADEDKNLVRLAEAFSRVRAETPDIQLVFAGKTEWGFPRLKEKLKAMNILAGVVFTDYVAESDLPALYSGARALAMPSLHEGFGLPVLEAMACGTPALCSSVASLPEVAGDAALLVDPYNVEEIEAALRKLLFDDDLRARLAHGGIERARRFTWQATAAQVLNVYRELAR